MIYDARKKGSMNKLKIVCFQEDSEVRSLEELAEKVVANYELLQEENKLLL